MTRAVARALALTVIMLAPAVARAHKPSDSYLTLDGVARGSGYWDIAVRDLDDVLRLDAGGDGAVTWGDLRAREADVTAYALSRLSLRVSGQSCRVTAGALTIVEHTDGAYARLPLAFSCAAPIGPAGALELDYRLLFDIDPQHRGLVVMRSAGAGGRPFIMTARDHRRAIGIDRAAGGSFLSFVRGGVWHIGGGLDHVLFLLALLLPAALRRQDGAGAWTPVDAIRPALSDVARIVTAFTAAHSLTLTCAALGLARMPARLTEPAIAASVVIAAADNVHGLFGRRRWAVAFALGLLHGFGFSSALADAGSRGAGLLASLLGFNLGVELGQLALVAAVVPIAFLIRRTAVYRRFTLPASSVAIALVALVWFVERALDVRLLPGSS